MKLEIFMVKQRSNIRHDWTQAEVEELHDLPFNDLLFRAQGVHRQYFDPNRVQISTLLSIKTGACPEVCKYYPQSALQHQPGARGLDGG